jgi:hypothetical protein
MEMAAGFGVLVMMAIFWDISPPVFQRSMSPPYSCSKSKHVAGRKECCAACCVLVSSLAYSSFLKMEVICSSEMQVELHWNTQCYVIQKAVL